MKKEVELKKISREHVEFYWFYFITFFSVFDSFVFGRSMINDTMDDFKFKIWWFKSDKVNKKSHNEL